MFHMRTSLLMGKNHGVHYEFPSLMLEHYCDYCYLLSVSHLGVMPSGPLGCLHLSVAHPMNYPN